MKNSTLYLAILACSLAGCGESTQSNPTFSLAKRGGTTQALGQAILPLEIDEAAVREVGAEGLAGAAWTAKACELTSSDGATEIIANKGSRNLLEGFVIDPEDKPPGEFDFVLKGEKSFRIPVSTGWSRNDVAEFFRVPRLASAGFRFVTQFEAVPAGTYGVDFYIVTPNGTYFCESGKTIRVR